MTLHDEMVAIGKNAVAAARALALISAKKKNAILEGIRHVRVYRPVVALQLPVPGHGYAGKGRIVKTGVEKTGGHFFRIGRKMKFPGPVQAFDERR